MKIESQKLRVAFEKVRTLAVSRSIPALTCVRMEAASGTLTLTCTDLEQYQSQTVECDGDLPPTLVNANKFAAILPDKGKLTLAHTDGRLSVKFGKSETILATVPAGEFPDNPATNRGPYVEQGIDCAHVAEGIAAVAFCAKENTDNQAVLANVHINSTPTMLIIEAANGRDGAFFERPLVCPKFEALFSAKCAGRLVDALLSKGAKMKVSGKGIIVSHDSGSYYCAQYDGQYPNTGAIKGKTLKHLGTLERDNLIPILDVCMALHNPPLAPVGLLTFGKDGIRVEYVDGVNSVDRTAAGEFETHTARVNIESLRKCVRAIKGDGKCELLWREGALAFRSGDMLIVSMNLKG